MKRIRNKLLVITAALLISCGGDSSTTCTSTAIMFGDSITEQSGTSLEQSLQLPVKNLATSGETTYNALEGTATYGGSVLKYTNFYTELANSESSVIYLRYGMAEAIHAYHNRTTIDVFENNLSAMIVAIRKQNKIPVLVAISPAVGIYTNIVNEHNIVVHKVSSQLAVMLVDIRQVPYTLEDIPDGIHPTTILSYKHSEFIAKETKELFCN